MTPEWEKKDVEILNLLIQNLQDFEAQESILKILPLLLIISQVWEPLLQLIDDMTESTFLN